MTKAEFSPNSEVVRLHNENAASSIVLVCEHAAAFIPEQFDGLGLSESEKISHVAWDPGALAVAERMAKALDAKLVAGTVSRLVYDCNRPPEAADAMPTRSETTTIPGNLELDAPAKAARIAAYYVPFRNKLAQTLSETRTPIIVTIHSFTPVYHGKQRRVEIGILHDDDSRLADLMLTCATKHTQLDIRRNHPYGPTDGVTHTLREHALPQGHMNVMLEIRNDLIATEADQDDIADMLTSWISAALTMANEGQSQ